MLAGNLKKCHIIIVRDKNRQHIIIYYLMQFVKELQFTMIEVRNINVLKMFDTNLLIGFIVYLIIGNSCYLLIVHF